RGRARRTARAEKGKSSRLSDDFSCDSARAEGRALPFAQCFAGLRDPFSLGGTPMTDRRAFHEQHAPERPRAAGRFYHRLLERYFSFILPQGQRVLELGCGLGDLLAALKPARGVGVDFSPETLALARQRHPELQFHEADATSFRGEEPFDYILLSDLINDLPDVQAVFENARNNASPQTRLVLNFQNSLWRPLLALAERLGAKSPTALQNWLSMDDVKGLLHLAGWEVIRTEARVLWPVKTPLLGPFLNRWL